MIGAILGDIVGSQYEFSNFKQKDFKFFTQKCNYTDDTICTIATADWLVLDPRHEAQNYARILKEWCRKYPHPQGAYGNRFKQWVNSEDNQPYGSYGNGSAMRVSPVGWYFETLEETLKAAETTARVTHDHYEGIQGAKAVAAAIFLSRTGREKKHIRNFVSTYFGYNLSRTCDEIRPSYSFNESCQGTVPEAIIAFLESNSFEDAIRNAISLGGDADTLTCITGAIAEAYYGTYSFRKLETQTLNFLPDDMLEVRERFLKPLRIAFAYADYEAMVRETGIEKLNDMIFKYIPYFQHLSDNGYRNNDSRIDEYKTSRSETNGLQSNGQETSSSEISGRNNPSGFTSRYNGCELMIPFDWSIWLEWRQLRNNWRNVNFEELRASELLMVLTALFRGERFCQGAVDGFVVDGYLLKLLLALREKITLG